MIFQWRSVEVDASKVIPRAASEAACERKIQLLQLHMLISTSMEDCNDSWPDAQGEIRLGDAHKTQLFVLEEVICKSVLPQHM